MLGYCVPLLVQQPSHNGIPYIRHFYLCHLADTRIQSNLSALLKGAVIRTSDVSVTGPSHLTSRLPFALQQPFWVALIYRAQLTSEGLRSKVCVVAEGKDGKKLILGLLRINETHWFR